jgi:biopolymer transport protein ExbB/TolQ
MSDTVPLREYLEAIAKERDLRYQQRFVAQEAAIVHAEAQRQLDHQASNQWREQFHDMENTLMPRRESQATTSALADHISELREKDSSRDGGDHRGELTMLYLIACLGPAVGLISIVFTLLHSGHP